MTMISPHFSLEQLVFDPLAYWHAIHQQFEPGPSVQTALRETSQAILEPLYKMFGTDLQIISGYRHKHLNFLYGGNNRDYHVIGRAVDIRVRGLDNWRLIDAIRTSEDIPFHYLAPEYMQPGDPSSGWVHVSHITNAPNKRAYCWMRDGVLRTNDTVQDPEFDDLEDIANDNEP